MWGCLKMINKKTMKTIVKLIISAVAIVALVFLGYFLYGFFGLENITQEQIQEFIASKGAIAPIIFILISFAQVTLVPIPGAITILAGNYLFGPVKSFIYSYIGMLLGAMAAFILGRLIGRPFVNWIAGRKQDADLWIDRLKGREKIVFFFMFLLPLFPDDVLCAIAGLFKYSTLEFLVLQLITRATSIFGTLFFMSGEVIPHNAWGITLVVILAVAAVVAFTFCMKHYEEIEEKLNKLFNKNKSK